MNDVINNIEEAIDTQKINVLMQIANAFKGGKISKNDLYMLSFYADVIQGTEKNRYNAFNELSNLNTLITKINYNSDDINTTIHKIHEHYAYLK